jgi:hypothetical protein
VLSISQITGRVSVYILFALAAVGAYSLVIWWLRGGCSSTFGF